VTDERRAHPLIVVSPTASASSSSTLIASAHSSQAWPSSSNSARPTFYLRHLGKETSPGLCVRVLFLHAFVARTFRSANSNSRRSVVRDHGRGRSTENELLSIVAHRMNLTNSRRHIRPEACGTVLRGDAATAREAEKAGSTAELLPLTKRQIARIARDSTAEDEPTRVASGLDRR